MKASASKAALLLKCGYSFRDDVEWPKEKTSAAAQRGTHVHKLIADFVNKRVVPDFEVNDWVFRRAMQGISAAKVHAGARAEITYAMGDPGSAMLGSDVLRESYPTDFFCGTADLIWEEDAGLHIRDWKTGSPSDADEWQLRALAAMVHVASDKPVISAKSVYLTDGAPRFGDNVLEETDPMDDAATLRKHLKMVPTSEPSPGHWCKSMWCKVRTTCPAINP